MVVQIGQVLKSDDERFLRRIFGKMPVTKHAGSDSTGRALIATDEFCEGLRVAA